MIKLLNILNEWRVIRPPRVHNLDKPGVKFEDIQIGDMLKFSFYDELGHDTVMQRVISLDSSYIGGIATQDLDSKGNLKPNARDYWDKNAIENYWQTSGKINEWKIVSIPKEWKKYSVDPDPDPEQDIEIESYSTPMEGWDNNNHDIVSIYKTPKEDALTGEPLKVKYYVIVSLAFGDYITSDYFDTYFEAKSYAVKEMNEITEENNRLNEWKIKQPLYHKGQTLYFNDNEFGVVLAVLPNYEAAKSIYGKNPSIVLPDDTDIYFGNLGPNAKDEYWYLLTNEGNTKWLWNEGYLKFMLNSN